MSEQILSTSAEPRKTSDQNSKLSMYTNPYGRTAENTDRCKTDMLKTADMRLKTHFPEEANVPIGRRTMPIKHLKKGADVKVLEHTSGMSLCTCRSSEDLALIDRKSSKPKRTHSLGLIKVECSKFKDSIQRRFATSLRKAMNTMRKNKAAENLPRGRETRYWVPRPIEMFLMAHMIPVVFVKMTWYGRMTVKVPLDCHKWEMQSKKLETIYSEENFLSRSNSSSSAKKRKSTSCENTSASAGKLEADKTSPPQSCSIEDSAAEASTSANIPTNKYQEMSVTTCPSCKKTKLVCEKSEDAGPSTLKYRPWEKAEDAGRSTLKYCPWVNTKEADPSPSSDESEDDDEEEDPHTYLAQFLQKYNNIMPYDKVLSRSLRCCQSNDFSTHHRNGVPIEETCWYCGYYISRGKFYRHCISCAENYYQRHKISREEAKKRTMLRKLIEMRLKLLVQRERRLNMLPQTSAVAIRSVLKIHKRK